MWAFHQWQEGFLVFSLRQSMLKENRILSFAEMVPFLCACIIPLPVGGFWEFLDFFNIYFLSNLIFLFFYSLKNHFTLHILILFLLVEDITSEIKCKWIFVNCMFFFSILFSNCRYNSEQIFLVLKNGQKHLILRKAHQISFSIINLHTTVDIHKEYIKHNSIQWYIYRK